MSKKKFYLFHKAAGVLLAVSASLKLLSVSYMTELLFTILPLAWMEMVSTGHLRGLVIAVSLTELALGALLWSRYRVKAMKVTIIFLLLMLLLNSWQWYAGAADCGCLGGWITLPPAASFTKTMLLLGGCLYLNGITKRENWHQEYDGNFIPSSQNPKIKS